MVAVGGPFCIEDFLQLRVGPFGDTTENGRGNGRRERAAAQQDGCHTAQNRSHGRTRGASQVARSPIV